MPPIAVLSPCRRRAAALLVGAAAIVAPCRAQGLAHRDGPLLQAAEAAFDATRGRLVAGALLGETWEFDGGAWFRRAAPRTDWAAARWVATAQGVFAFAVDRADAPQTWDYDGVRWTERRGIAMPPPRRDMMLAFDAARGRVVLFGGTAAVGPNYYLTDTWEWDGAVWSQRAPAVVPQWRRSAAIAFDAARSVTLMFGGDGQTGFRQDTWAWDGTAWTQRGPVVRPSARMGAAMAFDPALGQCVLHGGLSAAGLVGDLWRYDGVVWAPVTTTNPGPVLYQHGLHHDAARGELLALGGTPLVLHALAAATWRSVPVPDPVLVSSSPGAATIDPGTGGVVRFGSLFGNETQVWNRRAWASLRPPISPPGRLFGSMWSDGANAWLFGGTNTLAGTVFGDTWRWDGALWWPVGGAGPGARHATAVAFDTARGVAVLFGGSGPTNDTWTFDGATWTPRGTAVRPPARSGHGLAFDPGRGRVVLFGGTGVSLAQRLADTWEWDGAVWQPVATPQSPPAVGTVALGYDVGRQRVLLSQSGTQQVGPLPPDLWTYDGATWTRLVLQERLAIQPVHAVLTLPGDPDPLLVDGYAVLQVTAALPTVAELGIGCGTAPGRLWVRTLPRAGAGEFGLELDRLPANAPTALLAALAPGGIIVAGCRVEPDPSGLVVLLTSDARGAVALAVPLAASPALVGLQAWFQAFALGGGGAGFVASAGVVVGVGD
jgi:hypothetical protein